MNKYQELLERPEWKEKRERILKRDDHRCQRCGATDNLQVHHFNYDAPTPWDVPDQYLMTLCKDCHKDYHIIPVGLRICDQVYHDCDWDGFSIERLKKQGFEIHGSAAILKSNGYTLFLKHQSLSNTAVATLFKDSYGKKRYHECQLVGHIELDDYLEDYLELNPQKILVSLSV